MLGKVTFSWTDPPAEFVLGDDARWSCPGSPEIEQFLNDSERYGGREIGPADGRPGMLQVNRVADEFGGRARFPHVEPDPPGRVY